MSVVLFQKQIYRGASKVYTGKCSNIFSAAYATRKEYQARKLVGFSDVQMYTVVSDVKNYEKFVPFCTKSLILKELEDSLHATLEIGFPPIIESYTSHVKLIKPQFVSARCRDGNLFNYLETTWHFSPGLKIYSQVATMFFEKLVQQMEWAFISEAKRRYGRESVPSHNLTAPPLRKR